MERILRERNEMGRIRSCCIPWPRHLQALFTDPIKEAVSKAQMDMNGRRHGA